MHVLILEDNVVTKALLQKFLNKKGHHVFTASGAQEALNILDENENIQLVLTHWLFKEIDGTAFVQHIKKEQARRYIYIIVLTAMDTKEEVVKALNSGADDYIMKPFNKEELSARIHVAARIINFERKHKRNLQELSILNKQMAEANEELKITQSHLLQQEKMASIGQLAAGVAHEINNPAGFVYSNLGSLDKYVNKIIEVMKQYEEGLAAFKDCSVQEVSSFCEKMAKLKQQQKMDFIKDDIKDVISESQEGMERIKKIVADLKSFSHVDQSEFKFANINEGLESTLNVVWNELKYKCSVEKDFGELPQTYCNMGQLNQVFVNILVNAAQAIETQGTITIATNHINGDKQAGPEQIEIRISDTGCGIEQAKLDRIFEPFFTTKEVGKGTGLGMSIAYDIVKKHNGKITVQSTVGEGTTFTIILPVMSKEDAGAVEQIV